MRRFAFLLSLALPFSGIPAQIPQGYGVISHFKSSTAGSNPGGIYAYPLHDALAGQWISGLGTSITGTGSSGVTHGAGSILVRESDGALVVGQHTPAGLPVDIHVIQLNGFAVAADTLLNLGVSSGGGNVDQMAWLPDGRVLFIVRGIASGPFAVNRLGILDLVAGTATPVPVSGLTGTVNALTVDAAGTTAYIGCFNAPAAGSSRVYSVPLPGGGPATIVATLAGDVLQLVMQDDGMILVGLGSSVPAGLLLLHPPTGTTGLLHPSLTSVNAMAFDGPTGDRWFVGYEPTGTLCGLHRLDATAALATPIACGPVTSGVGVASGIAIHRNLRPYGPATATADTAAFALSPNPGGAPLVGNAAFSLTVTSALGVDPGIFVLSTLAANQPVAGFTLLVDFAAAFLVLPLAPSPSTSIPLPIPADPQLSGIAVFAQAGFAGPAGLATTSGLRVVIR